jgi:hypothetical protein
MYGPVTTSNEPPSGCESMRDFSLITYADMLSIRLETNRAVSTVYHPPETLEDFLIKRSKRPGLRANVHPNTILLSGAQSNSEKKPWITWSFANISW